MLLTSMIVIPGTASATVLPDLSPLGANDWDCKPSAEHPRPVVLVHGITATMATNWITLSPLLKKHGYCVFALNYGQKPELPGVGGLLPVEESAAQLGTFVDEVLRKTGASTVDIVGHSEGSLMPSYWVEYLGGAAKITHYVGLTPLWRGTNAFELRTLRAVAKAFAPAWLAKVSATCQSCGELVMGSAFLAKIAARLPMPGVRYTSIRTIYDLGIQPHSSAILAGADNIVLQDGCPGDLVGHAGAAIDPRVGGYVLNALDADHPVKVPCVPQYLLP
ncbi:lipase [Pseudonocardiaceae bacterium YIM PH 21723]|nr:lipase [Pseudonocardiaceae bacterium YIM PH 21723]